MQKAYDLVIRGGTVGVRDGRIAAVGPIAGSGAEEIDARGQTAPAAMAAE